MKDKPERKNDEGMLLGPKRMDEYQAWRKNRDKLIANPRRLKTCKDDRKREQ